MSNQEINRKWQGSSQEIPSGKSQQRSPIGFDEAKQLSQAHGAKWKANIIDLALGKAIAFTETAVLGSLAAPTKILEVLLELLKNSLTGESTLEKLLSAIKDLLPEDRKKDQVFMSKLKKNEDIKDLLEQFQSISVNYHLSLTYDKISNNKILTSREIAFLNENGETNKIEDLTKIDIVDYFISDAELLQENSNMVSILNSSVVITEDMIDGLTNLYLKSEIKQDVDNFQNNIDTGDSQGLVNFFSKNTSEADSINRFEPTAYETRRVLGASMPKFLTPTGETQEISDSDKKAIENEAKRREIEEKARLKQAFTQAQAINGNKPSIWNAIGDMASRFFLGHDPNQYVNLSREEAYEKYRGVDIDKLTHVQWDSDPMASAQIGQMIYSGGIYHSNMTQIADNSPFRPVSGSLSNDNSSSTFFSNLTVDDVLKDPKFIQVSQNIANNETYKQLYEYNQEIYQGFRKESPITAQDRDTLNQMHELIVELQQDTDDRERTEKK